MDPIQQRRYVHQTDNSFDSYVQLLKKNGAIISQNLQCGIFKLKNGLPYAGLYAKQEINPTLKKGQGKQEILVTIPVQLLLTSFKAQKESDKQLSKVYESEPFYHSGPIWQNRIIITYVLYILERKKDSLWAKMARNFSKDIDILSFWTEKDLEQFKDKSVIKAAHLQRQSFEQEWNQFSEIQRKHEVLQLESFTYQNYKWIYIHVISRCFGSFLNASYFVPFCEFFNHNCVDVSYCCLEAQEYEQKLKGQPQLNEQNQIKNILESQPEEIQSLSQFSGNSEDYIEDGDFRYDLVSTYTIKWGTKVSYKLKPKELLQIQKLHNKVSVFLDQELQWKGFGLLYIGEILEKNNLIVNQYKAERKRYEQAKQELELLLFHVAQFKRMIKKYYKRLGSFYLREKPTERAYKINEPEVNLPQNEEKQEKVVGTPPDRPYKYFSMICHSSQNFPPLSQVYFQYNRLSNRTLLLRYGFSLENNKFQHVWVRKSLVKEIGQYPDLFQKMQAKGAPVVMNVKLKPYVLNSELIILEKIEKWKMYGNVSQNNIRDFQKMFGIQDIQHECEIIERVVELYQQQLLKYQLPNQKLIDLSNKQLGYHDYFRSVYLNQKVKILRFQIQLLQKSRKILKMIEKQKIPIKGNSKLLKQLQLITQAQMGSRERTKMVWGYIKTLNFTVI